MKRKKKISSKSKAEKRFRDRKNISGNRFLPTLIRILCLAVIIVVFCYFANKFKAFMVDDAFISFRYARNLIEGHGLVYNVGERVEGYTNFLWTLLIAIIMKIGLSPELSSQILGVIFGAATIFLIYRISYILQPKRTILNLIAPLFLAINPAYVSWSVGGMETLFFTFLLTAGFYMYLLEGKDQKRLIPFSPIFFALATLTRPEGIIFFLSVWLNSIILTILRKERFLRLILSLLIYFAIYLPYFFWRLDYYGYFFPNTFYAKVDTEYNTAQYIRGLKYLKDFAFEFSGITLLLIFFVRERQLIPIIFASLLYLLYIIYIGGDALPMYRFIVPILPLLYLCVQSGIQWILYFLEKKWKVRGLGYAGIVLIVAVSISFISKNFYKGRSYEALCTDIWLVNNWKLVGKWLKENASADESIAVSPAGAVPYYSGLYTIDMLGLNDLHIAHMKIEKFGSSFAGHEKGCGEYVLSRKPTYILLRNVAVNSTANFDFKNLVWNSWGLKSERELWFNPRFHQMYQQVAARIGKNIYLHYFRLKEEYK